MKNIKIKIQDFIWDKVIKRRDVMYEKYAELCQKEIDKLNKETHGMTFESIRDCYVDALEGFRDFAEKKQKFWEKICKYL